MRKEKEIPRLIPSGLKQIDGTDIMCLNYEYCLAHPEEFNYFEQMKKLEELDKKINSKTESNQKTDSKQKDDKKKNSEIKEDQEKYIISNIDEDLKNDINNKHDKLFKDLFSKKDEVAKFLNKYLKLEVPITGSQLEEYKTEYVTSLYEKRETDIVYKLKDKNIFFLIEHQSTIDRSMPFRISDYSNLIIKQAIDKKKMKRADYKYPRVIPIVLYTGNIEWNASFKLEEIQETLPGYNELNEDYKIIDINKYSKEELLSDNILISKAMIMEKCKTNEELMLNLEEVARNTLDKKIPLGEYFLDVIQKYIVNSDIRKETKEIIEKIKNEKGDNSDMLNMVRVQLEAYAEHERIGREQGIELGRKEGKREGKKEGKKEGREEERKNIVKALLRRKTPIEDIIDVTGMSREDIIKLQNEKVEV